MNTRTNKEPALPKQQKQLSSKKSAPYSNKKNGSTPPLNDNSLVKSSETTVTLPPLQQHHNPTKISPQQAAKKEKTRQYNKAHREKLKRDGKLEDHKERVRQYNAKRRQALNTMARENGLSVRKMEQTLKETKKSTGVDLLSEAIHGEKKESYLHSKILPATLSDKMISNDNTSLQHMTSCQPHRSNATDCTPNKATATAVAASQQQAPQPSSSSPSPPPSLSNPSCDTTGNNKMLRGEAQLLKAVEQKPAKDNNTPAVKKKNKRKATVSPDVTVTTPANKNNKAKVARPTPTPARGGGQQQQPTTPSQQASTTTTPVIVVETEKRKKDKHNHHNRIYRDKLKQDKRRYEEHKEKARQYNERRRKKLRAMAQEVGMSMKEMEKTIKEAKIISALTITASKEAETSSCCLLSTPQKDVPHVIGRVSPPQEENDHHHQQRERANSSLDILSNAASILLSQQPMSTDSSNATPSSPTRQFRAVSEDNFESD